MDNASPDCVIALAFGYRRIKGRIVPGTANEDLARIVHRRYNDLPKILQFEVADAYRDLDSEPVLRIEEHRTGSYLDTREVLLQAHAICEKSGWKTVALVAHPGHLDRVRRCAQRMGLSTDHEQLQNMKAETVSFDSRSEQSWTRTAAGLWTHEKLGMILYRALRYV